MEHAFRLFGRDHVAALAVVAVIGIVAFGRARRGETRAVCLVLAFGLLGAHLIETAVAIAQGSYTARMLPLQVCDLAGIFGAVGLLMREERAVSLAYFFALSGTLPALLAPELSSGWPSFAFVVYFVEHGLTVVAPLVAVFALRIVPGPRAWWSAVLALNGFAILDACINAMTDANLMYLQAPPRSPTPFDWFGPWPGYIVVLEVLVVVLFRLFDVPLGMLRTEPD